jgi:hypothetical protein
MMDPIRIAPGQRAPRPHEAPHPLDAARHREHAEDFDRLLREKVGARDDGGCADARDEATGDTPRVPEGLPPLVLPLVLPPLRGPDVPQPCPPLLEVAPLAQAAFAAARAAELAPRHTEAAGSWEVSVREPLGVPVELHATRAESTAAGAPWTLTLSSSSPDAGLLGRHAPRLDERLRKRLGEAAHLRIERDDGATR